MHTFRTYIAPLSSRAVEHAPATMAFGEMPDEDDDEPAAASNPAAASKAAAKLTKKTARPPTAPTPITQTRPPPGLDAEDAAMFDFTATSKASTMARTHITKQKGMQAAQTRRESNSAGGGGGDGGSSGGGGGSQARAYTRSLQSST